MIERGARRGVDEPDARVDETGDAVRPPIGSLAERERSRRDVGVHPFDDTGRLFDGVEDEPADTPDDRRTLQIVASVHVKP